MTELTTIPDNVLVHPISGEARELAELTHGEIREGIAQLDELSRAVTEARQKLAQHVWDRKNAGAAIPGVKVERSRNWKVGDTAAALDKLIRDGEVEPACRDYIVPVESFKANGRSLNALADWLIEQGKVDAAGTLLSTRRDSIRAKVDAE